MKILIKNTALFFALAAVSISCSKDEEQANADFETKNSKEVALVLNMDEEISQMGESSLEGDPDMKTTGNQAVWANCASWSIDTNGQPNVITLDFGTSNCQGADGNFRRGTILISYEDNPFDAGSIHTITAQGYAVNDFEVNGTKAVTYQGLNASNDPYSTLSSNLVITRPDGSTVRWTSARERVWVDGFGNLNPFDNAFEVSGDAQVTTSYGRSLTLDITTPLRIEATCGNIVSGTLNVTGANFTTRVLDYGNGTCDRQATVSLNGSTRTILLR